MFFRLSLLFKIKRKTEEKVISPSPPVWIKTKITIFPNVDHWKNVSCAENPVTQVAEVEVKRQSKKEICKPLFEETGKNNKKVPIKIIAKKLKQTVLIGLFFKRFLFLKLITIIKTPSKNSK